MRKGSRRNCSDEFYATTISDESRHSLPALSLRAKRSNPGVLTLALANVVWVFAVPVFAHAQIRISEFLFNAEGADSGKEWVEIYNSGDAPVDISKWRLKIASPHALISPPKNGGIGSMIIAPHAYAVLADNAATFRQDYQDVPTVIDTTVSLPNSKGTISLLNGEQTVDAVSYTNDNKDAAGLSLQKI